MNQLYVSPFGRVLQNMKKFSITTCVLSVGATPYLWQWAAHSASMGGFARYAAVGAVLATGVGSTSMITWTLKPYILSISSKDLRSLHDLEKLPRDVVQKLPLQFEMLDVLGRRKVVEAKISDLKAANSWRPWTTWEHKKTGQYFYAHPELLNDTPEGERFIKEMNR